MKAYCKNNNYVIILFLCVAIVRNLVKCPPIRQELPSQETINFMKNFGYIEAGPDTDALYTETGFKDAVRQMQKFGGLEQTGELNEETLKLTRAQRCGVPDVVKHHTRTKRYIVGSDAWKKRNLTYYLGNWPSEFSPEQTAQKLKDAFDMWSRISPLKFFPVTSMASDLIIAFGRSRHGDGYPFDGPGLILAHAFFPYEHGHFGGDIHFDDDENWIDGSEMSTYDAQDGVDFYTVATHEIGHSLGLAHSTVPGSIMFPYYKGYNRNMQMDYDDIVAMHEMYVINGIFSDDNVPKEPVEDENKGVEPDEPVDDANGADKDTHREITTISDPYVDQPTTAETTTYVSYKEHTTDGIISEKNITNDEDTKHNESGTKKKIPDICEGFIDAIGLLREELFVFKGLYVWRLKDMNTVSQGYPVHFHTFFRGFPWSVKHIDAVYQRPNDFNIVFFSGQFYWVFNGNQFLAGSPKPITDLGLPPDLKKVDAALVWAKNGKTYFFAKELYWRFDEKLGKVENSYPQRIQRWKGVPANIDGALTWKDNFSYFFKDNKFWRLNNQKLSVDVGFPLAVSSYWFNCHNQK